MSVLGEYVKVIFLSAALFVCGLAHAKSQNYYYGTVKYYSSDGTSQMGQTVSLVSRMIDSDKKQIVETVTQPKENKPGANEFTTELNQKTGNSFTASDAAGTFTGEIIFFGNEWSWASWDYRISLNSGGGITGSGFLTSDGILTNKNLRTQNFEMKILEDLKIISESEYMEIRNGLFNN